VDIWPPHSFIGVDFPSGYRFIGKQEIVRLDVYVEDPYQGRKLLGVATLIVTRGCYSAGLETLRFSELRDRFYAAVRDYPYAYAKKMWAPKEDFKKQEMIFVEWRERPAKKKPERAKKLAEAKPKRKSKTVAA
jgi:hypothetical protein